MPIAPPERADGPGGHPQRKAERLFADVLRQLFGLGGDSDSGKHAAEALALVRAAAAAFLVAALAEAAAVAEPPPHATPAMAASSSPLCATAEFGRVPRNPLASSARISPKF